MSPVIEPLRCPRCGRRPRVLDLTATTITCLDCDPAYELVRRGVHPAFGGDRPGSGPDDDGQYDPSSCRR